jgi:LysR family transcriptional regulator for bpeEF and oprC
MSPSAISKAVSRLEERLGARLLNRTTRSLSLTDLGTSFYDRCREALSQLDQAESEVTEAAGVPRGKLRVDVPVSLGRLLIVPALPRFIAQHPEVTVQMSMNDRVVDLVQDGIDMALRVGELSDSSLIARRVGSFRVVTCASPEFIERNGAPITPEDLQPEQCIAMFRLGTNQIREWMYAKNGVEHTIFPRAALSFSDPQSAVTAGGERRGIRALARFHCRSANRVGIVTAGVARLECGVVSPGVRRVSAASAGDCKVKAFIDFVAGLFPQAAAVQAPTQSSRVA